MVDAGANIPAAVDGIADKGNVEVQPGSERVDRVLRS